MSVAKQRIHPNLIAAVSKALVEIFQNGKYADKVIETTLKGNRNWGARDRKFIAETVYGIVRHWRMITEINDCYRKFDAEQIASIIGIYLFLNGSYTGEQLGALLPRYDIQSRYASLQSNRAIKESVPDWLDVFGQSQLGAEWESELHALNQQAEVFLRTNTLKVSRADLRTLLGGEGTETSEVGDGEGLRLAERKNIFLSKFFRDGYFEVQDIGSQQIAPFLKVESGHRVVDACAGGGGKSLHLAVLMANKGKIIALDTEYRKLDELRRRANRNGVSIIETRVIESLKAIKRLSGSADRLLLDVPCSGSGVLRRNPDAKWKLREEHIRRLVNIQRDILDSYVQMVKVGGLVVYATCSMFPIENHEQIKNFLSRTDDFVLEEERRLTPFKDGTDGFYMARLKRII